MESSEIIQRLQRIEEANEVTGSFSVTSVKVIWHSKNKQLVLDRNRFQIDDSLPKPQQFKFESRSVTILITQNAFIYCDTYRF